MRDLLQLLANVFAKSIRLRAIPTNILVFLYHNSTLQLLLRCEVSPPRVEFLSSPLLKISIFRLARIHELRPSATDGTGHPANQGGPAFRLSRSGSVLPLPSPAEALGPLTGDADEGLTGLP